MKNPNPVNMSTQDEIRKLGWAAEARDSDGHLLSTRAWLKQSEPNENALGLAEFITDYSSDSVITIFPENITA